VHHSHRQHRHRARLAGSIRASAIGARLYAATVGFELEEGETAQSFQIKQTAARKIPKQMIGRVLQGAEVEWLMKILPKTARA